MDAWTSAGEIAKAVAAGGTTAVVVVEAALARVEARNPLLNAFTAVTRERALAKARAIDEARTEGKPPGPLAGIPFAVPPDHQLPDRLAAVLAVVYLIFNQGWGGGRVDLAAEAVHVGRALAALMPDEPEVLALLALMLLHDARKSARLHDALSISATAMARFISTIEEPVCLASVWYSAAICGQSRGCCRCRSAMAACTR